MHRGDQFKVWVNQGNRHAVCLAVVGRRALIQYRMPNGGLYLWECDDFDPKEKDPHYGKIINRQMDKLPQLWLGAIETQKVEAMHRQACRAAREALDRKWAANTGFRSLEDCLSAGGNYRPSLDMRQEVMRELADDYDAAQAARGDDRRAYRYGA